jgi:hypothetical protein
MSQPRSVYGSAAGSSGGAKLIDTDHGWRQHD